MSKKPTYLLLAPKFPSWQKAFNWAWHVARTSQRKTLVQKVGREWRVLRQEAKA